MFFVLCVQGEVAANGGLKVRELAHSFQLVVTNGDGWRRYYTLSRDVRLLQTDSQPKVLAGLGETVH